MDLTPEQARLVRELVSGHKTNCEGHIEAMTTLPELAEVAEAGWQEADAQITLCDQILSHLEP